MNIEPLIKEVVNKIVKAIKPEQVILFGSRARGNAYPESDIDLLIVYNGTLSKREIKLQIRRLFPQPDFSMDIFVLNSDEFERQKEVVSTLGRVASREGIVCYG